MFFSLFISEPNGSVLLLFLVAESYTPVVRVHDVCSKFAVSVLHVHASSCKRGIRHRQLLFAITACVAVGLKHWLT